jgi:hypothetical protein
MALKNWYDWHRPYEDATSDLSHRLEVVQRDIEDWLDSRPEGDLTIVSLCAGQGRDVLGILRSRPRDAGRLRAWLVETDERNVRDARATLKELPPARVEIWQRDAGADQTYRDLPKADLLLLVGIFGNVSDEDVHRTIQAAPLYCNPGARVVWSRGRGEPDLTPSIRQWFSESGFIELRFDIWEGSNASVGYHVLTNPVPTVDPAWPIFTFLV